MGSEDDKEEDKQELNEPLVPYVFSDRKKIRIFNSFEEAQEAEDLEVSQIPPVERLRKTVELILRAYGVTREELKKRKKHRKIKITLYK